jgi:hypothetical protein
MTLFIAATIVFFAHQTGKYYTDHLFATILTTGTGGPNQIITLSAILHFSTNWPDIAYQAIQNGFLILVIFLSSLKRTSIAKAFLLYIVYYLCFYSAVFEYQWSTLAYVIAVCIVTCREFQTRIAGFCILLTCLPDCFYILNLLHIDTQNLGYLGLIPGAIAWKWMVISKLVPLFLLLISVFSADVIPILRQMKTFWNVMSEINEHLELFGVQKETRVSERENLGYGSENNLM